MSSSAAPLGSLPVRRLCGLGESSKHELLKRFPGELLAERTSEDDEPPLGHAKALIVERQNVQPQSRGACLGQSRRNNRDAQTSGDELHHRLHSTHLTHAFAEEAMVRQALVD